jgi:ATP-dependent RNA helicase RhlE
VAQELKTSLLVALLNRGDIHDALVFTRTKHRANRVADFLVRQGVRAERIHGNRSQSQRTLALAGFKSGKHQVLVATDIAARGIDVQELGHVVNFDVPKAPEDYIHRVGRTARAEMTGDAFTFVSPQEEADLSRIERAIGKRLPRITVPDFDYKARPEARLEQTSAERRAESRAKRPSHGPRASSGSGSRGGRRPNRQNVPSRSSGSSPSHRSDAPKAPSGGSRRRRPGRSRRKGRSW